MKPEPGNPLREIFDELFGLLESLEAQSMAVMQFLKDQKIGNDKKLAPYLEQAGNASSVKWRAAGARMEYLLAPMQKEAKEADDKKKDAENKETDKKAAQKKDSDKLEPERQEQNPEKQKSAPADSKGANPDKRPAGDAL